MKSHYRAVVIGGGVVGASVLYHLTRFGWSDVALIERAELTAGSTWHAAAGFHALNADPNVAALQDYTIKLYREIEAESGQNAGLHMTGGVNMASDPQRWEWLKSAWAVFQSVGIETARLVTPKEIKEICPIVDVSGVLGGLYDSNEGHLDPYGTTHAYAGAARKRGADVILRNRVVELKQRADGGWDIVTEKGAIVAEHVVNAGGLWAKQVGLMAGVDLPVTPMEHHYFVTEDIPEVAALDKELGLAVDLDGFSYLRQERKGVLLGVYEQNPKHWNMDGAPWDYGIELIPEDIDRISPELAKAYERFPCLATAGIRKWVNGAFTFTPDGNPLVGPVRGLKNYWVACGVMAGFSQGGGVGKSLAEWMIYGEPEADIFGMDSARYGAFAANREYLRQTTGQFYARRFVMTFPNERLPAGRPLKRPGAYDGMSAAGAEWTASWGLEIPAYFAPMGFREETTLKRSNAFEIVGDEVLQVRRAAGLVDTTAFSRYAVSGPGAEAWLDRLLACRLPKPGRAKLALMLGPNGRLKGDLTVLNWGGGEYWIMGSYYLREFHMRWFEAHIAEGVSVTDISDATSGFLVTGPNARKILERTTHQDISAKTLPFMACGEFDIGMVRARVARLSIAGELGFEINCPATLHATLRETLLAAGQDLGLAEIGYYALNSLRLEKSFGIWSREFTQGYTPGQTGLDRFIAFDKAEFIGRDAALKERDAGVSRRIVTLEVDAVDADASGFEPVWSKGRRIGFVTSGGYGYTLGKSVALALLDDGFDGEGTELSVHIVGVERPARIIAASPYDPEGKAMRQ
ncbi:MULTISPECIES: FAD-dependent oxidoreductase [unclassified Mesorhizobium]|uniref:GcvT family protein n=12 Tax=Mesorhizobium TaxID=68287 RepID=UPI000F7556E7|nr:MULTISPECIES: FAD-dependent oxidoreductase [unclassified Mesorhizobium]AZO06092.1 FAD-dependent oxidoreductase [Mesorhizobium sp. M2A.F.Ca.ET.043.02.1.1]RUW40838.1 FAD-dependent oxidoreductase [Mesorhizobium sp. M2A.F.Ca.ET.015.02.1.1]RWB44270.1 MAG: FAD-dependent oxidoreductase [Mesorhizobium sp.]RWB60826.1 MAG: FAD-dependent oxidoreductase [Mesorhizobium sp.]RWB83229.1 MAG: FAD-dependent oxidoreductase [Mesorhizobium sp.]